MLKSRFPQIIAELAPRIAAGLEAGAKLVEERAKDKVHVGTGDVHLRDAIHTERGHGGYVVIAGDDQSFYGHMVEFGTSHSPPHPFLIPALEESEVEIRGLVLAEMRNL